MRERRLLFCKSNDKEYVASEAGGAFRARGYAAWGRGGRELIRLPQGGALALCVRGAGMKAWVGAAGGGRAGLLGKSCGAICPCM